MINRSGSYIKSIAQGKEVLAFLPNELPFSMEFDKNLDDLHSDAAMALGRLNGLSEDIRHGADFFSAMYLRKEAASSSQVEGTMATFADVLQAEAGIEEVDYTKGTDEIINYISALQHGIDSQLPFSKRLIKEIHQKLLIGVRGYNRNPGEMKRIQNWVGGPSVETANFIPCPPEHTERLLDNLEKFINLDNSTKPLIKAALMHAQFENIHPFLDGNGRIGRLMVTLYLCKAGLLQKPMLFLSEFFNFHKREYYQKLDLFHEQDSIEGWVKFFLEGVRVSASRSADLLRQIRILNDKDRDLAASFRGDRSSNALKILDKLYKNPFITIREIEKVTGLSYPGAIVLANTLEKQEILVNQGSKQRNKKYYYRKYLDILIKA